MIWTSETWFDDAAREDYQSSQRAMLEDDSYEVSDEEWSEAVEMWLYDERQNLDKEVDGFIVDVKDMNPEIYRRYTGRDNGQAVENLRLLAERGRAGDVLARVPLIPGYNTEADRRESIRQLEGMGFGRFDEFTYITGLEYEKRKTDVLHFEGDSPADSGGE